MTLWMRAPDGPGRRGPGSEDTTITAVRSRDTTVNGSRQAHVRLSKVLAPTVLVSVNNTQVAKNDCPYTVLEHRGNGLIQQSRLYPCPDDPGIQFDTALNPRCNGTTIDVFGPYVHNFFHSTAQYLVATYMAYHFIQQDKMFDKKAGNTLPIVVIPVSHPPSWLITLFKVVCPNATLEIGRNKSRCSRRVISAKYDGAGTSRQGVQGMSSVLKNWAQPCVSTPKALFVVRGEETKRQLLNRANVTRTLAAIGGLVPVIMEDLSLREQICHWAQADFVVGEHGAGLTSVMYMARGTTLIEIAPLRQKWVQRSFRELGLYSGVITSLFLANANDSKVTKLSMLRPGWPKQRIQEREKGNYVNVDELIRETGYYVNVNELIHFLEYHEAWHVFKKRQMMISGLQHGKV